MGTGKMAEAALSERLPDELESSTASEAVVAIASAMKNHGDLPIKIEMDGSQVEVKLTNSLGELVLDLLSHVARGELVTLVPYSAELTTQKAADLLNVSRPFLTKLLENGEIPFHRVGSHRRVKVEDLLRYKDRRDSRRASALDDLQRLGQEFDAH